MDELRGKAVILLGLAISVAALAFVAGSVDLAEAGAVLTSADPLPVAAILVVVAIQVAIRATRWSFVLPVEPGADRISPRRLAPPMLVGYLGNAILPARLGEPMRALLVARREQVGTTEALGSVFLERVVDVATLALVAFAASLAVGAPGWIQQGLGVAAAASFVGLTVLLTVGVAPVVQLLDRLGLARVPTVSALATRFAATLGGPSRRPAVLAAAGISLAAWGLDATTFWLAAQAVGLPLDYPSAVLVAGVTVLGTAIPSAPGFVGTFELAAAGTVGALGFGSAPALAMAVIAHVMTLGPLALAGAASLVMMGARLGEVAAAAESAGGVAGNA